MAKLCQGIVAVALLLLGGQGVFAEIATAGPCDAPVNEIVCENSKVGNPATEWDIEGSGDPSIQGFTTDISVNHGQAVRFKIKTDATAYHLDIYRMGYYGGDGARKVASSILPSAKLPQSQPACKTEGSTGLFDCGNWSESASWTVPSTAVSGIYFAKLVRTDKSSEGSHDHFRRAQRRKPLEACSSRPPTRPGRHTTATAATASTPAARERIPNAPTRSATTGH